ncbi:AAA family ATPase [Pseudoalteromonas sp. MMG006]|uniref:AAA family ATPase n=1 Tax=Pseudoalteromonas sp. MMG006 TaxID=2822683 RepID=UPI001B379D24|nr:AAA family ATPase [Pseudoalteromonas sp. MMG006]MBQ4798867.1 AAA family ATPase [Pseudoalteromonas sp. MMG006]
MLYILGGLPATGKTELSKYLSSSLGAVHIRIDTIEQELKSCGFNKLYDEGYKIAFALALENLKNGLSVVADSTNPVLESREAWISVANKASSPFTEIEVICSNENEHRERVEKRQTDIPNLLLPSWESVTSRDYHLWKTVRIVIDTAGKTPEQSKKELSEFLRRSNET